MYYETTIIDSNSMGNPERHTDLADLEQGYMALTGMPKDRGRVALVVRKGEGGRRETPERVALTPEGGVTGDAWGREGWPVEAQVAVMQKDVAELIANGQPLTLFGDNLFLELDVSTENLPTGSRVRVGGATLEVTPKAHNGCQVFRARFGDGALRFTAKVEQRHLNLRGIYMRVVTPGEVGPGDPVEVLHRAPTNSM
jgi:MOSC domain-containing protein YiiM